jgi:hypothetical protein
MAAVLACGADSLLSHRAAAHLWGLGYFPGTEEVTLPRTILGPPGVIVHTSRTIKREQRLILDAIPVTSINRTLVDLADVVKDHRRIAKAVHEADVQRALDVGEIQRLINGRHGAKRLKRALAAHRPADLKSGLEFDFLSIVSRAGLPHPQTNVLVDAGARSFLVDFLWSTQRLIVEVDGPVHRSDRSFESDRERDSLLQIEGFRVIRFTKHRVQAQQRQVLSELSAHLGR